MAWINDKDREEKPYMVNPTLTKSFLKYRHSNQVTKCLNKAGVAAMGEEYSTNGKFTTVVINFLSRNCAKEGEPLIDKRYKKCYLNTDDDNYLSELYNSKDRVLD